MEEILNTNARAVLEVLRASQRHPTALDVYEAVRKTRPRIGLATVYRVLHQLTAQGLIKELEYGSGCSRYDARTYRHDHAFCTMCGALLDVPQDIQFSTKALQVAAQSTGFKSAEANFDVMVRAGPERRKKQHLNPTIHMPRYHIHSPIRLVGGHRAGP